MAGWNKWWEALSDGDGIFSQTKMDVNKTRFTALLRNEDRDSEHVR